MSYTEQTFLEKPTFSDTRTVVALAERAGIPTLIVVKGAPVLVRSLAELDRVGGNPASPEGHPPGLGPISPRAVRNPDRSTP